MVFVKWLDGSEVSVIVIGVVLFWIFGFWSSLVLDYNRVSI